MKVNAGGILDPKDVVGRDRLIQKLWRILKRRSLVLSAERRMGKTCVIRKMVAESPEDKLCFFRDLEGIETSFEFVQALFQDVEKHLATKKRISHRTRKLLENLGGAKFEGFTMPQIAAPHWKDLLTRIIQDLQDHQEHMVVFFWDEFPMMLQAIQQRENEQAAMEVLNILRFLRQTHPRIRMVFSGSIGLHNVITHFKRRSFANEPINDMHRQDLPPLTLKAAKSLASQLIRDEQVPTQNEIIVSKAIAEAVDCIPYYLQNVIEKAVIDDQKLSVETVEKIVTQGLIHPLDAWDMRHYRERISVYYSEEEKFYALAILDVLAQVSVPLHFDTLFNLVKSRFVTEDIEMLHLVLKLLTQDHYLLQNTEGSYHFKFPLIQRWWKLDRGITQ